MRYEYDTPPTDPSNRMATFDFKTGMTEQVGTDGLSRSGTRPAAHNFAPRVGFAWSPPRIPWSAVATASTTIRACS